VTVTVGVLVWVGVSEGEGVEVAAGWEVGVSEAACVGDAGGRLGGGLAGGDINRHEISISRLITQIRTMRLVSRLNRRAFF
jgi:hypothetical protein